MRVPLYSLVFFVVGVVIGVAAGSDALAMTLGGSGSVLGYVLWVRARVQAVRAGMPFHIFSIVNILICTICALGLGVAGMVHNFVPKATGNLIAQISMLVGSAVVIRLHWLAAKQAREHAVI